MNRTSVTDDQALEALLSSAQSNQEAKAKAKEQNIGKGNKKYHPRKWDDNPKRSHETKIGSRSDQSQHQHPQGKRQRLWNKRDEEKLDSQFQWGDNNNSTRMSNGGKNSTGTSNNGGGGGDDGYYGPASNNDTEGTTRTREGEGEGEGEENSKPKIIEKPNFGLSGALAEDENTGNTYNGIVLKFTEPPEARTPNTRWRLYVFKKKMKGANDDNNSEQDDGVLQTLHISRQSAYLFGRERKVADIPVDHPSLSKQHCVLQHRAIPDKNDREHRVRCKPYLMDLGSTNGTFINGERIDDARYYELRKGDVITLGASSREYVLLTENTTSSDL